MHNWVTLSEICADHFEEWAPEMLCFNVERVPCLVMLDSSGMAIFRPRSDMSFLALTRAVLALFLFIRIRAS